MGLELAENRINLLSVNLLERNTYAVSFEYQYINLDKSRVWQKDVAIIRCDDPLDLDRKMEEIVDYVKQVRAELEK